MKLNSKYRPLQLCLVSSIIVLIVLIESECGKSPVLISGRHAHDEVMGVLIPLFVIFLPALAKELRDTWWTKINIVLVCSFLFINLVLIIFMKINQYNYYTDYGNNQYWWWLLY